MELKLLDTQNNFKYMNKDNIILSKSIKINLKLGLAMKKVLKKIIECKDKPLES